MNFSIKTFYIYRWIFSIRIGFYLNNGTSLTFLYVINKHRFLYRTATFAKSIQKTYVKWTSHHFANSRSHLET